jgi:hypothetical protein
MLIIQTNEYQVHTLFDSKLESFEKERSELNVTAFGGWRQHTNIVCLTILRENITNLASALFFKEEVYKFKGFPALLL